LPFTFETIGRYKDSLDAVIAYEDPEVRRSADQTNSGPRVTTQLAVAYNNFGDHPKAVTLLKGTLEVREGERAQ
jgi:hypothetical protein